MALSLYAPTFVVQRIKIPYAVIAAKPPASYWSFVVVLTHRFVFTKDVYYLCTNKAKSLGVDSDSAFALHLSVKANSIRAAYRLKLGASRRNRTAVYGLRNRRLTTRRAKQNFEGVGFSTYPRIWGRLRDWSSDCESNTGVRITSATS
jgi:hypothetical protein